ncbi:unnamed protein product, partial [Anisakis simplex]|uniref:Transcription initiation factor TFIID subunit 7-like n=1 Tax=Anisakis simplex TaxID=6269 RepID=A0A0M3J0C9_ANISI
MPKRDDSDEESTAIAAPIELPISSKVVKPTIAKIIEDENIATSDDDDDDQKDGEVAALSVSSNIESDIESDEKGDMTINYDFTVDTKEIKIHEVLNKFPSKYDNIIAEFADVEIFLISLDGLLIELTSHWYLNWELGGQTIVIAKQVS